MQPLERVSGTMAPLDRADVDTDQIIPKQFLKRIERTGYGPFLFFDWRKDPTFFLNQSRFDGAAVLVAGANFGCGSSREHAPWAIRDAGFRAVIAPSFGDIFRANAFKTGVLAVELSPSQVQHLIDLSTEEPAARIEIDVRGQQVRGEGFSYPFELDPFIKHMLLNGLDEIGLVEQHTAAIGEYETHRLGWLPALK